MESQGQKIKKVQWIPMWAAAKGRHLNEGRLALLEAAWEVVKKSKECFNAMLQSSTVGTMPAFACRRRDTKHDVSKSPPRGSRRRGRSPSRSPRGKASKTKPARSKHSFGDPVASSGVRHNKAGVVQDSRGVLIN